MGQIHQTIRSPRPRLACSLLPTEFTLVSSPSAQSAPAGVAASAPPCAVPTERTPEHWFVNEVQPHGGQLKSWLRGQFPSIGDVDDVVQESYLRIWKARMARPIESAKAFLFTVARHLALDQIRRNRISPITGVGDLTALLVSEDKASIPEALSREEKLRLLSAAIVALPHRMREIIILHKIEGLAQAEVAARLAVEPKTVENLVGRGMKRIREFLRHRGIEHF